MINNVAINKEVKKGMYKINPFYESQEEVVEHLKKAEKQIENGEYISEEEFHSRMKERLANL